jgi:hypothetical protein
MLTTGTQQWLTTPRLPTAVTALPAVTPVAIQEDLVGLPVILASTLVVLAVTHTAALTEQLPATVIPFAIATQDVLELSYLELP